MKVTLNDAKYIVQFQHFTPHKKKRLTQLVDDYMNDGNPYPSPTATLCGLYQVVEESGDDFKLVPLNFGRARVSEGFSALMLPDNQDYPGKHLRVGKDTFNRVVGKKIALARAIRYWPREQRKAIFDQVFPNGG